MEASRLFYAILKNKRMIIASIVVLLLLSILYTIFEQKTYKSSTKWLVKKAFTSSSASEKGGKSQGADIMSLFGEFSSTLFVEAAVLTSPELLREIVKQADIRNKKGKYLSYESMQKRLTVTADKKLPFLTLVYESPNKEEVVKVLNLSKEVFINSNVSAEAEKAHRNKLFIEEEINKTEDAVRTAATKLKSYESKSNVISIDKEEENQQSKMATLAIKLADLKSQLAAAETEIRDTKRKLGTADVSLAINKTTLGSDDEITRLKGILLEKRTNLISLETKYTEKHPTIIEMKDEIDQLENKVENRIHKVLGQNTTKLNPETAPFKGINYNLTSSLVDASTRKVSLQSQIKAIEGIQADNQSKFSTLPAKKSELESLNFELLFQSKHLETLKKSLETAKLNEAFAKNSINVTVLEEPEVPLYPFKPNIPLNLSIGLILGLLTGVIISALKEYKDKNVYTEEDLKQIFPKKPVLGTLYKVPEKGTFTTGSTLGLIYLAEPESPYSHAYRKLKANIKYLFSGADENTRISLGLSGYGTRYIQSVATANLAIAFAKSNFTTLILDLNLLEQNQNHLFSFNFGNKPGLFDYLKDQCLLDDIVEKASQIENLYLIRLGTKETEQDKDILFGDKIRKLIHKISEKFDVVLYDLGDIYKTPESLMFTKTIDNIALVAEAYETRVADLMKLKSYLEDHHVKVAGTILTEANLSKEATTSTKTIPPFAAQETQRV